MAYANITVTLQDVRFQWLSIFDAKEYTNDKGESDNKYEATLIIEPDSEADKAMKEGIQVICQEQFGAKWEAVLDKLNKDGRNCYKDGNTKTNSDGEIYDGFEGMMFLRASRKEKKGPPFVYNAGAQIIKPGSQDNFTGDYHPPRNGDYGVARVNLWTLDGTGKIGRRIVADLELIMVQRDGDPLGSGGMSESSADDFASQFATKKVELPTDDEGIEGLRK